MGNLCPHHCPGGSRGRLGPPAVIAAVVVGVGLAMAGSGHGSGSGSARPATTGGASHAVRPSAGAVPHSAAPAHAAAKATHAAGRLAQHHAAGHGLLWWALLAVGVALAVTVAIICLLAGWDLMLRRRVRLIIGDGTAAPSKPATGPAVDDHVGAGSPNGHREADAGTVVALRRAAGDDR